MATKKASGKKRTNRRSKKVSVSPSDSVPVPGVTLRQTLRGHTNLIGRIAWSPDGSMLATPSSDRTVCIWDSDTGELIEKFFADAPMYRAAWSSDSRLLAATSRGSLGLHVWDVRSRSRVFSSIKTRPIRRPHRSDTKEPLDDFADFIAWSPTENILAICSRESQKLQFLSAKNFTVIREHRPVSLWPLGDMVWSPNGKGILISVKEGLLRIPFKRRGKLVEEYFSQSMSYSLSWTKGISGEWLAAGGRNAVDLLDVKTGANVIRLEGHTSNIESVTFSSDGRLLASRGNTPDNTVRLWRCDTWEPVAVITEAASGHWPPGISFHPQRPILATLGEQDSIVRIWELDTDVLLRRVRKAPPRAQAVHHTTAKIVLVGDSGAGKTGLGWRLAHGDFKEHSSTHGQQFWVLDQLAARRRDRTECEAILWDLAGQPDYRLTHALFLNDADLALLLFDPTDSRDPLHGVEFWLRQLRGSIEAGEADESRDAAQGRRQCPTILVGGRTDRGGARLTQEELGEFCRRSGISGGYIATSAKEGIGLDELLRRMKEQIPWDRKTKTVTTVTFKRIKDFVLELKENRRRRKVLVRPVDLRKQLEKIDTKWNFGDDEMMTAVRNLENYGYVRVLRTSKGEIRILLVPELLNNLAASFVLEARQNRKGLGSLEEGRLLAGEYRFRELDKLSEADRDILLDSAALLFLKNNICFRETDPLTSKSYLVFPELINLKKPPAEEQAVEDGPAYTVVGAVENVYASLVVLLGYTQTFTRTNQWQSHARYEVGEGLICGFRQDAEREGELDLVLYFGTNVGAPVRALFQGLFESFLARRNLTVTRFEPVACPEGHTLNRAVVREEVRNGTERVFCPKCGKPIALPNAQEPIQLTLTEQGKVDEQQWFAAQRSRFEQALFRVKSYVENQGLRQPECFISYAWGDRAHERWVERSLATDLNKAGISVLLDRWENSRIGASVMRFIERINECDKVIVVGTPAYRNKYKNRETQRGFVVAAEGDLIAPRMLGTEAEKESVLPLLRAGDEKESLPPWLEGRVYADFRAEHDYFITTLDLILSIYGIHHRDPAVADLRESLMDSLGQ